MSTFTFPNRIFIPRNINMYSPNRYSATAYEYNENIDLAEWIQDRINNNYIVIPSTNNVLQNGNTFGGPMLIGTNDNQDLRLETNAIVRATINGSGNMGVGVAPTTSRLTVEQSGSNNALTIQNGTNPTIMVTDGTVQSRMQVINGASSNIGTVSGHPLNLITSGVTRLTVGASGNVGIGTTNTNASLQLSNTVSNRRIILWEDGNNDHQYWGFGVNGGIMRYQVSANTVSHVFYSGNGTSESNELMRITGMGRVCIGTSTPNGADLLTVNGSIAATSGSITVFSDKDVKSEINEYNYGLEEVLQINPVRFKYNKKAFENVDIDKEYVGIIAQDIESIMPETVNTYKVPLRDEDGNIVLDKNEEPMLRDMKSFSGTSDLIYTLINAVKTLNARIEALEASLK